jgi:ArsR family transcriptional regulator
MLTATVNDAGLVQALDLLKVLTGGERLRIVAALARAETCVCDLIDIVGIPQALLSYHLRKLREAGFVRARRDAQWVYYSIDPDAWRNVATALGGLFGDGSLPPAAAWGAGQRCEVVPADADHGSCDPADPDCC